MIPQLFLDLTRASPLLKLLSWEEAPPYAKTIIHRPSTSKKAPAFQGDSSNVDVALTCFAIVHTQARRSTFKYLLCLRNLVAGTGFEPVTFRL